MIILGETHEQISNWRSLQRKDSLGLQRTLLVKREFGQRNLTILEELRLGGLVRTFLGESG